MGAEDVRAGEEYAKHCPGENPETPEEAIVRQAVSDVREKLFAAMSEAGRKQLAMGQSLMGAVASGPRFLDLASVLATGLPREAISGWTAELMREAREAAANDVELWIEARKIAPWFDLTPECEHRLRTMLWKNVGATPKKLEYWLELEQKPLLGILKAIVDGDSEQPGGQGQRLIEGRTQDTHDTKNDTPKKTKKKRRKLKMNTPASDCARLYRQDPLKLPMKTVVADYVAKNDGSAAYIMRVLNDNPDQWKDDINTT